MEGWLAERFRQYRGNADVVRQELAREHGIRVSLRTVERAVADLRRDLLAEARLASKEMVEISGERRAGATGDESGAGAPR